MRRREQRLFVPWLVWATLCAGAMWQWPGEETVPYHLGYAALAVAFGLDTWSNRRAYTALACFTAVTGAVLVSRADAGIIDWGETAEIPLMALLMALMVWHVGDRHAALAIATRIAERDRDQALRRERIVRVTSHEMRTPLTIATGYVDVLRAGAERGSALDEDLAVVHDELDRISRAADRLLRMIRFHEELPTEPFDLDAMIGDLVLRWQVVAARDWRADTSAGTVVCSQERLRACLDTLVENAVRYTSEGQTIRVFARQEGGDLVVGVGDGGSGLSAGQAAAVNQSEDLARIGALPTDARSRTGLGLSLVREIVESRGGGLQAGRAPEGGALVVLRLPQLPSWAVNLRPLAAHPDLPGHPRRRVPAPRLGLVGR